MVAIRNINDIILGLIDYFKLVQPDLDTKPGTVARDLFIEAPSAQLSLIYEELSNVSNLQSFVLVAGANLDKLAKNFGLSRSQSVASTGIALLTFNNLDAPFAVNQGDLVITRSGLSFKVVNGVNINVNSANLYKATANKFKNDLDFNGITDQYAVQVLVQCVSPGANGNIGKYSLARSTSNGINSVVNPNSFSGGSDQESDAAFRNRILSLFNGSSIGTALGYRNLAITTQNVFDAFVVEPGDPLMTRDGTVVSVAPDGTRTILSEGNGGKVDIIVLGENLIQTVDSFVYQDKSNMSDPSSDKNDFIIGQIIGDENKTINKRRLDNIKNGTLPSQPVDSIVSVVGSLSGPNFKQKTIDSLGRVSGNYELVKDSGEYAGSPWGFDKFKWISNKIENFSEDVSRQEFNTQDRVSYTDVVSSSAAQQNILIFNENSKVTSDRSIIQLLHYPCLNVTRVYNVNTGQRYIVSDQNPDGTSGANKTGRIKISGNNLPLTTDVLQVDYTWVFSYDPCTDYDGKLVQDNIRSSDDTIDWGYGSKIKDERVLFTLDGASNLYIGSSFLNISSIASCNEFIELDGTVFEITSGINTGRKSVVFTFLKEKVNSINSIYLKNTFKELYNTAESDGSFTVKAMPVPGETVYQVTIVLPSDTLANEGDICTATFNASNVYTDTCNFTLNKITIPSSNIDTTNSKIYLNVSYIANVKSLLSSSTSSLPLNRLGNGFISSSLGTSESSVFNLLKSDALSVQKNLSDQYYIEIDPTTTEFTLNVEDVIAVVRQNDSAVMWDEYIQGTISFNTSTFKYQIIFNTSSPAQLDDQVIVFYYSRPITKAQPFSFINYKILSQLEQVKLEDGKYYVPIVSFSDSSSASFEVISSNYSLSLGGSTGNIVKYNGYATLTTSSSQFDNILDITSYKIKVIDGQYFNNNGVFDIVEFNQATKTFTLKPSLQHVSKKQISVINLQTNKELWNSNCTIDATNNKLIFSGGVSTNDRVFINYFNYNNLRQSATNLSSVIFDQNISTGSVLFNGSSLSKIENVVFNSTNDGLTVNLTEVVLKGLGYSSPSSIPSSLKLARLVKLEKVQVATSTNEVVDVIVDYNLKNYKLNDNSLFINESIEDSSLSKFEIVLPPTTINQSSSSTANNVPAKGDKLRATFYLINTDDVESLNYTIPGNLYSSKKFVSINKISSSGFNTTNSSVLTLNAMNQPTPGSRYKVYYDYTAPKTNERIIINYNYNQTISDVTFNVENNRPINADVIVKQASKVLVDVTLNIVITASLINSSNIVAQSVKDALISAINFNSLGGIIDASDLVNTSYSIDGVDRARIIYFNKYGVVGQALSLTAQNNEYFVANNVIVNIETR